MTTSAELYLIGTGVPNNQGNLYVDLSATAGTPGWTGRQLKITGGADNDWVYVPAGVSVNFTEAGTGNNRLYLAGNLSDYSQTIDQDYGYYKLTRTVDISGVATLEVIQFRGDDDDDIYFADGKVNILDLVLQSNHYPDIQESDLLKSDPTPADPSTITGATNAGGIRMYLGGAPSFYVSPLAASGQVMIVTGSASDETVYAKAGSSLNFSDSGTGTDHIYLPGKLSDYTQKIDPDGYGYYTLTRIDDPNEVIIFRSGDDPEYVHFADGYLDVQEMEIKADLNDPFPIITEDMLTGSDTTAPTAIPSIVKLQDDDGLKTNDFVTSIAAQKVSGSLSETLGAGEIVQVSLDGTTWIKGTATGKDWTADVTLLAGDDKTLSVRTIDAAGNVTKGTSKAYVLDTVSPAASVTEITKLSIDTNVAGDFVTYLAGQSVSGKLDQTLEAGEIVQISANGVNWITASTNGLEWTADGVSLKDGTNTLITRISDLAGNIKAGATHAYTVDRVTPTITGSFDPLTTDSGVAGDYITNAAAQSLSGVLSGKLGAGETLDIMLDGAYWATPVVTNTLWSLPNVTLPSGTHTLSTRVMDLAGNFISGNNRSFTLDTTPPLALVNQVSSFSQDTNVDGDFVTSTDTQTVKGTLSATLGAGESVEISVDGSTWIPATTAAGSKNWTASNVALSSMSTTLHTRTIDLAGNSTTGVSQAYTLDQQNPTVSVSAISLSLDTGRSPSDFVTATTKQTISVTLNGSLASGESVQYSSDDNTWYAATKLNATTWTYALDLQEGKHSLYARTIDLAGNTAGSKEQVYTLDTVSPGAAVIDLQAASDTGNSTDNITTENKLVFDVTGEAGAIVQLFNDTGNIGVVDAAELLGEITLSGTTGVITSTALSIGTYTQIKAMQTDIAGNQGVSAAHPAIVVNLAPLDLQALDNTSTSDDIGFVIKGAAAGNKAGAAVSFLGDFDNDGYADMIVGAPDVSPGGYAYVIYGKSGLSTIELSNLGKDQGFALKASTSGNHAGSSVSSAGDFNGDGMIDLIIGAPDYNTSMGKAYIVYGSSAHPSSAVELSAVGGTVSGFVISGLTANETLGYSVSAAGDVNGDGFADVIVGAPGRTSSTGVVKDGRSYVIFGSSQSGVVDLSKIEAGTSAGFVIYGLSNSQGEEGYAVSAAGDVNGDGYADLVIGAPFNKNGTGKLGRAFVMFGKSSTEAISLSDIASQSQMIPGFVIEGETDNLYHGWSVSGAGDVNGDGLADMIIGAIEPTTGQTGKSYVVFGKTDLAKVGLSDIVAGTGGFLIKGQNSDDQSGYAVSSAGDINGDGLSDLVVSSWQANPLSRSDAGEIYVVFGRTGGSAVELSAVEAGLGGFAILGGTANDKAGQSVAGGGDVDGDGVPDLIVGVPNQNRSYVLYSGKSYGSYMQGKTYTTGPDAIAGTTGTDHIFAGDGDDTVTSGGGTDFIYGGPGSDTIVVNGATNFSASRLDGGLGRDKLAFSGSGITLDLAALNDMAIKGIEHVDMTGSGNNVVKLGWTDLLNITDTNVHDLKIDGDAGDKLYLSGPGVWYEESKSSGYTILRNSQQLMDTQAKAPWRLYVNDNVKVLTADQIGNPTVEVFENFEANAAQNGGWIGGRVVGDGDWSSNYLTSAAAWGSKTSTANDLNLNDSKTILTEPTVYKAFSLSGSQTSVTVSFTFYEIDGWGTDNGNTDRFTVWLDTGIDSSKWDQQIKTAFDNSGKRNTFGPTTIDNVSIAISSDTDSNTIGGSNGLANDEIHTYTMTFNTSAPWFKLGFSASLDRAWNAESWGVDDLVIRENLYPAATPVFEAFDSAKADSVSATPGNLNHNLAGGRDNDTLIGNNGDDVLVGGGQADVLFGSDGNDVLIGGRGNDSLNGSNGNDTLIGGENGDTLLGGAGNDLLYAGNADLSASIDGGDGIDTLAINYNVSGIKLSTVKATNIERIDLNGLGSNTLTLDVLDVASVTGAKAAFANDSTWNSAGILALQSYQLIIDGDTGDKLVRTGTADRYNKWAIGGYVSNNGQLYTILNSSEAPASQLAQILVDTDIDLNGLDFDRGGPQFPGIYQLVSDTGRSDTDQKTGQSALVFAVTAEFGAKMMFYNDVDGDGVVDEGEALSGKLSFNSQSLFSSSNPALLRPQATGYVTLPSIADGTYSFLTAKQWDMSGYEGLDTKLSTITPYIIDTQAPPAQIAMQPAAETGRSSTDYVTSKTDIGFDLTSEGDADVTLMNGAQSLYSVRFGDKQTTTSFTINSLPEGTYSNIKIVTSDVFGNVRTTTHPTIVIDKSVVAPTVSLDTASDVGQSSADGKTNKFMPVFKVTGESGAVVTLLDGSTSIGEVTLSGTSGFITSTPLADGTYSNFRAYQVDLAGNKSSNSANVTEFEIDTVAPSVPTLTLTAASDTGDYAGDRLTHASTLVFAVTGDPNGALQLFNDSNGDDLVSPGELLSTVTLGSAQTSDFMAVFGLAEGTYANLKVMQMDIAGNLAVSAAHAEITVDMTADAPSLTLDKNSDSGRDNSDRVTNISELVFTLSGEAGATVTLFNDSVASNGAIDAGELLATAKLGIDGTVVVTTNTLAEGVYSNIRAIQTDAAGNVSLASAAYGAITINKSGPAQPHFYLDQASDLGKDDSDLLTDTNTLVFYATADVGSIVTLFDDKDNSGQIDPGELLGQVTMRAAVDAVTSSYLADGTYSNLRVIETDLAGNTSVASDAHPAIVILDSYAAVPVLTLEASADTGRLSNDRITNATDLAFLVTAEGGATVTLFDDVNDNNLLDTGEFSLTHVMTGAPRVDTTNTISTGSLAAGTYSHLKVFQVDTFGNQSETSAAHPAIVIDTTAPDAPVLALNPVSYDGPGNSIGNTNVASLVFNVTGEANAIIRLFHDSHNFGVADADEIQDTITLTGGATTGSLTSSVLVADTYSNFKLIQEDIAGNASIGTAHPAITVTTAIVNAVTTLSADSGTAGDFLTNVATQTVSGTYAGTLGAMEKIEVAIDGGGWLEASHGSGAWSIAGFVLTDGTHTINTRTVDTSGNTRDGASQVYTLDTAAPSALVSTIGLLSNDTRISNDYITNVAAQTISGTLSDTLQADEKVEIWLDGVKWKGADVDNATLIWSVSGNLPAGTHTMSVFTVDDARNAATAKSQVYTVDVTAPTAVVSAIGSLSTDSGTAGDFMTNTATQTVSGTLSTSLAAGEYVEVCLDDNDNPSDNTNWVTATVTGTNWSADLSLETKYTKIVARTFDIAGNVTTSVSKAVTLDTTVSAPTMKMQSASDTGYASGDFITSVIQPVFDVTGDSDVASIVIFNDVNGNGAVDTGESLGSISFSSGVSSGAITSAALSAGTYTSLKVMQTDIAGNTAASVAYAPVTIALEVIKLSSLNSGKGGLVIENAVAGNMSDYKVSSAGDINNDGLGDLLVGAYEASSGAGRSYVVFGTSAGSSTINLSAIDTTSNTGTGGFVIRGQAGTDNSGYAVSPLGDLNGDGIADIAIGAYNSDPLAGTNAGRSYVVFGKAGTTAVELSAIANGTGGFVINGQALNDNSGYAVSAAGDVNGDGLPDLLVGALNSDPASGTNAGRSYVVFGKTGNTAVDLSAVAAGTGGFVINGQAANDNSGGSVSAAGDVNGDGLADLLVGAPSSDPTAGTDAGRSYVIFGRTGTTAITLSNLSTSSKFEGFIINGQCASDKSGYAVSAAGDVNGDGYGDVIIGLNGGTGVGRAYVVFGKTGLASVDLSAVAAGNGGFMLLGASTGDLSPGAVSAAGDLNGDGLADLIVGGPNGDPFSTADAGRSYVVFGKTAGTSVNLSSLPASAGFAIDGLCANEKSGSSVASARDVDGDGLGDLIVSVNHPNGSGVFTNSRAYVILSSENNGYLTSFKGAGTKGADTLTGSGGVDVIYAGAGDDVIELGSLGSLSTSRINGGLGKDTLKLTGAGLTLDLASTNDYALKGIETIDLNTTGANTLKIKFSDLVNMMDPASHKLYINGDGNDTVQMQGPGAWVKTGTGTNAGSTYDIYGYSLGTGFDATATPKTASIEQIWLKQGIKVNSSDTMNAPVVETFDSFAAGGTYAESGGWQGGIVVRDDATLARSREFSNFLTTKTGYTSSGTTANFLQLNDENGTLQSNGTTLTAPTVSKAFSLSGQQKWVEVSFSFYEINTWDTPEKFNVWLDKSDDSNDWLVNPLKAQSYDGGSVQSTSNQVDDSLPAGITGMKFSVSSDTNANGIGFGTGNEEFHTYTIAFQTSGSWFSLGFSASLNDAWNSEAWGVDNLVIRESTAEPPAQTRGTTGGDTSLTGTAANDDIAGGQGADSIVGLAGDDLLVGGLGIDTIDGGDGNDLVLGGRDNDNLSGGNNDDTLIGGEGNDQLSGGTGNDVLIVDADDFFAGGSIVGGAGTDTLTVGDNGMSVNLTVNYVQSIERVNLTGNGANSLTLTVDDVVRLNENTNTFSGAGWEDLKAETKQFVVDGETGDSVISSIGTWTAAGTTYHDGQVYAIFNSGLAQLLIDMDISRTGFPVI